MRFIWTAQTPFAIDLEMPVQLVDSSGSARGSRSSSAEENAEGLELKRSLQQHTQRNFPKTWQGKTGASAGSAADAIERSANRREADIKLEELKQLMPELSPARAAEYLPHLNSAMAEASINTRTRQAAFLAQLAHESGELVNMEELADGSQYEGKKRSLGNTQLGDGKRFKGRGPIQLTGRANYAAASAALGIDIVSNPKLAATPEVAFRIAGWFWKKKNLNALADAGKFERITQILNGGQRGQARRAGYYRRAQNVLS